MWTNKKAYLLSKAYIDDFLNIKTNPLNTEAICSAKTLLRISNSNHGNDLEYFAVKYPLIISVFDKLSQAHSSTNVLNFYVNLKKGNYQNCQKYAYNALNDIQKIKNYNKRAANKYSYFLNDYHRIVSSSAFRRLQDKTQLFLMPNEDYSRTRLTHSCEVSALAEKIAAFSNIEFYLSKNKTGNKNNANDKDDCKNIAKVSGLLHDIGNPPFGHSGERTICNFFKSKYFANSFTNSKLNDSEKDDLKIFDGNAQSLRIASKLMSFDNKKGASLTAGVLGSIIKYPFGSEKGKRKLGYFISEKSIIDDLEHMGVFKYDIRNPFALILEAADDLAYLISDLEDGIHNNELHYEDFIAAFNDCKTTSSKKFIKNLKSFFNINNNSNNRQKCFEKSVKPLLFQLREDIIVELSQKTKIGSDKLFKYVVENEVKEDFHFLEKISFSETINILEKIKKLLFTRSCSIIENEILGNEILSDLMHVFFDALDEAVTDLSLNTIYNRDYVTNYEFKNKILLLLSDNLLENYFDEVREHHLKAPYYKMRLLIDFISGMTDSYAKNLHKMIKNIQ